MKDESPLEQLLSRPNRAAIVNLLGQNRELGFTELRVKLGIGVGTLYYHLDGLSKYVTQGDSKKYTLTDAGRALYGELSSGGYQPTRGESKRTFRLFPISSANCSCSSPRGEGSEWLGLQMQRPQSFWSLLGQFWRGVRVDTAMFFNISSFVGPSTALTDFLLSWAVVFAVSSIMVVFVWGSREIASVAAAASFAFLPTIFFTLVTSLRRNFGISSLATLYAFPTIWIFQVALMVWRVTCLLFLCVLERA